MTGEAERIAAGLSPKMRFNILSARELLNGGYGLRAHMHAREANALIERGLTQYHTWNRDCLTPLGIKVRSILLNQGKDQ